MKIQENAQRGIQWVYLPMWLTKKLALKKGDVLSIVEVGGDEIRVKVIRTAKEEEEEG